jgi:hypothetical protein
VYCIMQYRSRDSLVCIATGWKAGVRFPARLKIFVYSTEFRPVLKPIQPPIQRVPRNGSFLREIGVEADDLSSSSTEVKIGGDTLPLPHTSLCRGSYLMKHMHNFATS